MTVPGSSKLSAILSNALDHSKRQFVRIEWQAFASVVQITIKDNGCGIHPEDLHHIFKRFISRFSKDTQGIGLGLPLAKAIVKPITVQLKQTAH